MAEISRDRTIGGSMGLDASAVDVLSPGAIEATVRAEIDVQVSTAKRYPRRVTEALDRARRMALLTPETAESCFYTMQRKNEKGERTSIEGPSVRFAEILRGAWQNLRVAARVMDVGEKQVVCAAVCYDVESNSAEATEVTVRITKRDGRRYSDDMVAVMCNAGCSKAKRNVILSVIPRPLWEPIYEACREAARDDRRPMADRRQRVICWFKSQGVPLDAVLRRLERGKVEEITAEDLLTLAGLRSAIREGEATAREVFGVGAGGPEDGEGSRDLGAGPVAPAAAPAAPASQATQKPAAASPAPAAPRAEERKPAQRVARAPSPAAAQPAGPSAAPPPAPLSASAQEAPVAPQALTPAAAAPPPADREAVIAGIREVCAELKELGQDPRLREDDLGLMQTEELGTLREDLINFLLDLRGKATAAAGKT